jgi:rSAM/selenodomain-associated transferase 1
MPSDWTSGFVAVVMAKRPEPGAVKTRLVDAAVLGPVEAAVVAAAMLRCTVRRLASRGPVVLALTPDGCGPAVVGTMGLPDMPTVDQGDGDLGRRLDRVWRAVGPDRPLAFFGADSPDLPEAHLDRIDPALDAADAAVGPTGDGGYWTLAARAHQPALLREIDWGTGLVYDQTLQRAASAGLVIQPLPRWDDVDDARGLAALRRRLEAAAERLDRSDPLRELAEALRALDRTDLPLEDRSP